MTDQEILSATNKAILDLAEYCGLKEELNNLQQHQTEDFYITLLKLIKSKIKEDKK